MRLCVQQAKPHPEEATKWPSRRMGRNRFVIPRWEEDMTSLKGKTLFVSGGSRGIGLAIALRAARDGANVAIAAKTAEPHPKLKGTIYTAAEEVRAAGGKALPVLCDIRDEAQVIAAIDKTVGRIRRHRYLRQQCQRHQPDQFAGHRHEAVRPDDGHQHPRHLHGVEILHPASEEGRKPAHPDAVAAARHADKMVRAFHRLHHGQVRHEHVRAGSRRAN